MARINIFETIKVHPSVIPGGPINDWLFIYGFVFPGSISFNNIALVKSIANVVHTASFSLGIYSLNGSTLSLANSAFASHNLTGINWVSFATSATQDITPGNWYLGFLRASSSNNPSIVGGNQRIVSNGEYGGLIVNGNYSASTNALPSSIATSDIIKEGNASTAGNISSTPYVLITS